MKGQAVPNHRRRKGEKVGNNIDSATHNQAIKHHNQPNDRNNHLHININTEY
jgi:hypothetical protein